MTASRLHGLGPTIFGEMSALAERTGAINLGQGFPDTDGPAAVRAVAARATVEGPNQYPPARGLPRLRHAIAAHQRSHYGIDLDPETEVVVTTGATEAIAAAILGLVEPGDEVLMLEPYYDSYRAMVQIAGGQHRGLTLAAPDFRLHPGDLAAAITPRTRFLLLNSPHNPTGTVLSKHELGQIAAVAISHDLTVISDEVYEHLVYDGRHTPIATYPGMAERTLTISSIGKSFSLTGWKVGWASGPAHLVDAVYAAKQWLTYVSAGPLQPAAAYALEEQGEWPLDLALDLGERRDLFVEGLNEAGLPTGSPAGTYFAISDISHLGWRSAAAFCRSLPKRAGVVGIPMSVFYDGHEGDQLVRWAFCKQDEVLTEAVRRLAAADLLGPDQEE